MGYNFIELPDGQLPDFISLIRGIRDGSAIGSPDSPEAIKVKYESNNNTNAYTDAEKTKLATLEDSKFKGVYVTVEDLETAYPTADLGDYAYVDNGATFNYYAWNGTAWTLTSDPASLTPSEIKTLYESNADTNALTDADLALIQQNALDIVELQSPTSTKYDPQSSAPTHQEGQIWYDVNYHALAVQTDIPDYLIHIPTDNLIRIVNKTGATIPALTAVRNGGIFNSAVIKGTQAQADSMFTAFVIGITAKAILPDAEGWAVTEGHVHDVDTSGLIEGDVQFLSETIAGGLTPTNPKIASSLGVVAKSDALHGEFIVKINNLFAYPRVVGYMRGQTSPAYSLDAITKKVITNYDISDSVVIEQDKITGIMTMPLGGIFSVTFAGVFEFISTVTTRTVFMELYNITQDKIEGAMPMNIPRDAITDGDGFSATFTATAGDEYAVRLYASEAINIDLVNTSFAISSDYIG